MRKVNKNNLPDESGRLFHFKIIYTILSNWLATYLITSTFALFPSCLYAIASFGCKMKVSGKDCNLAASRGVMRLKYLPTIEVCTTAMRVGNVS